MESIDPRLVEKWDKIKSHLLAARQTMELSGKTSDIINISLGEYFDNNELGLAYDTLEFLGNEYELSEDSKIFWSHLAYAADLMGWVDHAARAWKAMRNEDDNQIT
jgi:hypothetical protein